MTEKKGSFQEAFPRELHFAGIGGIGMSGLAQMAIALGHHVTGSDRAYGKEENAALFGILERQGVKIYPQDGSRYDVSPVPGAVIYSTAVEKTNPDFVRAPSDTQFLHRSLALELSLKEQKSEVTYAVAGTCGKTSVTAWLAEALKNIGADPGVLAGGIVNAFASDRLAGNYAPGAGKYFVVEADESDKSLLNYPTDAAMVLNIGTDHYSRAELCQVFAQFLHNTSRFAVVQDKAYEEICSTVTPDFGHLSMMLFSANPLAPAKLNGLPVIRMHSHTRERSGAFTAVIDGFRTVLPAPGLYTADNACAVYTALLQLGFPAKDAIEAVQDFHGVWRRFNDAGKMRCGARVFDDYAHNAEKIVSCISAGRELASGHVFAVFQPHGFTPLKFMREELFLDLEKTMRPGDVFGFLPVYYAGGTASFTPTSDEVAAEYHAKAASGCDYRSFASRDEVRNFLDSRAGEGDVVLVMGARDNSLSSWSKILTEK